MKFGLAENIIEKIITVFENNPKVDKALIFGSRAKGNYRADSDIDIAVKGTGITLDDILKMQMEMEEKGILNKVDLLDYDAVKEKAVIEHIDRVGIVVYSNWKQQKLGDLCSDISYGYTASANENPIGPKFLRITDIVPQRVNWANVPYCTINEKDHKKYKLEEGDIVIARTGATTGYNYTFKDDVDVVFASYLIRYRINKNKANPYYIDYVLKSDQWKGFVEGIIGGSAQPGANAKMFAEFEILLPSLHEQSIICNVLTSLDNKIDLLHRQNKTLEELGETLFRNWFVEDEQQNIKQGELRDLIDLSYGKALKEEDRSGYGYPVVGSSGIVGYHSEFLIEAPGIVIGRKGTLGKVIYLFENFFPIDTTYFVSSKNNSSGLYFEYFLLKTMNFEELNSDSAVPGLNRDLALATEVFIPGIERIIEFNNYCSSLFKKINSNTKQIYKLTQLRDTLLLKLMSGEVRVVLD